MSSPICKLCFSCRSQNNNIIEFYSTVGIQLNITYIIMKHFWVQIQPNDENGICDMCWNTVKEFHNFYTNIETLHNKQRKQLLEEIPINDDHHHHHLDEKLNINFNLPTELTNEHDNILLFDDQFDDFNHRNPLLPSNILKTEFIETDDKQFITSISEELQLQIKNEIPMGEKNSNNEDEENDKKLKLRNRGKRKLDRNIISNENTSKTLNDKRISKKNVNNKNTKKLISIKSKTKSHQRTGNSSIDKCNKKPSKRKPAKDEMIKKSKNLEELKKLRENNKRVRQEENKKIREFFNLNCQICLSNNQIITSNRTAIQFDTISELRLHYRHHHNQNGFVACCNSKFYSHPDLLKHMHWHSNPNEFRCNICNKIYTNERRLQIHMDCHSTLNERKYFCDMCNDSFTIRQLLLRHFRTKHIVKPLREFKCDQCDKSFRENSILQSHIRGVHQMKNVHICDICAKVYKSKYQCQIHYLEHINGESPKVQCKQCGSLLKNEHSLKCHIRRSHYGTPMTCQLCGKIAPHSDALRSHMRAVHSERKFKCDLCDKGFKRAVTLREHVATHTGSSILYTCPHCPTTFNSNANLHSHRKKKHLREWLEERYKRKGLILDFNPTVANIT